MASLRVCQKTIRENYIKKKDIGTAGDARDKNTDTHGGQLHHSLEGNDVIFIVY